MREGGSGVLVEELKTKTEVANGRRRRHLSTIEALADVFGWRVSAIQTSYSCDVRVYYEGMQVRFLSGLSAMRHTFVGIDADEAFHEIDAILQMGAVARCDTCQGRTLIRMLEWTLPPLSSPEEVHLRMSFGQHCAWGPKPVPG